MAPFHLKLETFRYISWYLFKKMPFQLQTSGTLPKIAKNPRLSGANSSGRHEPSVPLGRNECEGFQFDPLPVTAATGKESCYPLED